MRTSSRANPSVGLRGRKLLVSKVTYGTLHALLIQVGTSSAVRLVQAAWSVKGDGSASAGAKPVGTYVIPAGYTCLPSASRSQQLTIAATDSSCTRS